VSTIATITTSFLPPFNGYAVLVAPALLILVAFFSLFADKLHVPDRAAAVVAAVVAAVGACWMALGADNVILFGYQLVYTGDARFAATAILVLACAWFVWTAAAGTGRTREATALAALSVSGAVLAVAALDLIVMLLALELTSMPAYVLIGYRRYRIQGLEGALKYFLLSVLTSLFMIYGASMLFGLAGSTHFAELRALTQSPLSLLAFVLLIIGLFAKLSAAPFHWWAPDAYAGSEPWTVSFAATVPKFAGILVIVRLIQLVSTGFSLAQSLLLIGAVASMVVGTFAALTQSDTRRLLAYSGVVNVGYILLVVAASAGPDGATYSTIALVSSVVYALAYTAATMGVLLVASGEGGRLSDLAGLSKRRPAAAWCLALFVLSLIGVPPLAGFFGKLELFMTAWAAGQQVFVVIATVVTVVSAFYYMRLIKAAFFDEPERQVAASEDSAEDTADVAPDVAADSAAPETPTPAPTSRVGVGVALGILLAVTLLLGVLSGPIITWLT
jgi:NADH-quinone oxidoreductase subunit N